MLPSKQTKQKVKRQLGLLGVNILPFLYLIFSLSSWSPFFFSSGFYSVSSETDTQVLEECML